MKYLLFLFLFLFAFVSWLIFKQIRYGLNAEGEEYCLKICSKDKMKVEIIVCIFLFCFCVFFCFFLCFFCVHSKQNNKTNEMTHNRTFQTRYFVHIVCNGHILFFLQLYLWCLCFFLVYLLFVFENDFGRVVLKIPKLKFN